MTGLALLITLVSGFGIGALAGLFGVGGGFLLVPLLTAVLDVPASVVVGSTACAVLGPSTTSLLARKTRLEDWRLPTILFGGLTVGVLLGASVLERLTVQSPALVERVVLSVYAVLLIGLGSWTAVDVWLTKRGRTLPHGWLRGRRLRPRVTLFDPASGTATVISVPTASLAAVVVGVLCGLLGISGGLVTVPLFVYGFGLRTRMAVKSSMVTVWLVSVQSTLVHAWYDHIELGLVVCLLVGGTVGARLATTWSRRLAPIMVRAGFAGLLLGCATFVATRLLAAVS